MKIFCNNEENGITIEIKIDDIKDDENMLYKHNLITDEDYKEQNAYAKQFQFALQRHTHCKGNQ